MSTPAAPVRDPDVTRFVRWTGGAGALATAVWLWLQLDLLDQRVFGNFYDIQARALLDGRLAVPPGSLGNEAFLARGQEYLYNPPGPSLLRMPLFLVTDRFDGRLTVLSMFLAWCLTVVVVIALIWRVRGLLRADAPLPRWEAVALAGFVLAATLGSTVLYLGAVPWVFHEAYAWAVACSLGATFGLIGVVQRASVGRIVLTGAFTLGAVLSRAPAGFAVAIAICGAAAWMLWEQRDPSRRGSPTWWGPAIGLALAGLVPVLIGAASNWAKFRHPWLFPIDDQVFTSLSEERRTAIEANGGDLFGLDIAWSTLAAYFRPDGLRFSSIFPFVGLPAEQAPELRGAVFDRTYRTGSVVALMPALTFLSVWGVVVVGRARRGAGAALLRWPLLGVALIPVGVVFGAYIAHRYTAEFVPFLVVAGAVGLVDLLGRLGPRPDRERALALAGLGVLVTFGVLVNVAVAVQAQALANPGPTLADHVARQERWSGILGGDLDDVVVASVSLPREGPADEVRIIGDCQAVFVGTGEEYAPWVEVGTRPITATATPRRADASGAVALARLEGLRTSVVALEVADGAARLTVSGGGRTEVSDPVEVEVGRAVTVVVDTADPAELVLRLDGEVVTRLPREDFDRNWHAFPSVVAPEPVPLAVAEEAGVEVVVDVGAPVDGCPELLGRYRERVTNPTG